VARMEQQKCLQVLDGSERLQREVKCTDLGQGSVHRRAVVNTAMNCDVFAKQVLS